MDTLHNPKRELAALLQELMDRDGIRFKEDLAKRIGIPGAQIRAYMREEQEAKPSAIIKIAKYAGMTLDEMEKRLYRVRIEDIVRVACKALTPQERLKMIEMLEAAQ